MSKIRLGLMGFGEIPRHIYRLCIDDERIEVKAIAELGHPSILKYLVSAESKGAAKVELEGNFITSRNGSARLVKGGEPGDIPWDMFDVDIVVDGTWDFRSRNMMEKHLNAGAKRVFITSLPNDPIDRVVIKGVNENTIKASDRLVSPGSATSGAAAITLKVLNENFGVDYASYTSVHSYTADQPLRDRAGKDFRRSRSAAENIIPVNTNSAKWIERIMPEFEGKITGSVLNVPVPNGSMMDLNTFLARDSKVSIEDITAAMKNAADKNPGIIEIVDDPIVSADVIDNPHSVVFDTQATIISAGRMAKTLTWYHSAFVMACRIKELILAYNELDTKGGAK